MAEQEFKELTKDNLKMEMIEIGKPAASSSSCACKWENGCPDFSNEPYKTEPIPNEDMNEVGCMNSCRLVLKTEPVDCKQYQCDLCQESVDHSSLLRSDGECVPDPLKTNLPSNALVISHSIRNAYLKKRMSTHTSKKSNICSLCDYKANKSSDLNRHMITHTEEKPYSCSFCDYKSTKSDGLKKHLLTHTGEKPYPCSLCDYRASQSSNLKRHILNHTGEKPHKYKCDICSFNAASKSNLVIHKRTHTGEKPYPCRLCDYRANKSGNLKRHNMLTHKYKCDICSFSAASKSNLVIHKRTHNGEKPYPCKLCDYRTNKSGNLKRHMLTHTGEKP